MDSAIVIAFLGAAASLGAAFWAYRSAKGARDSADEIYSKNHQISVIDRDADELQAAYVALVEALADTGAAEGEFEVLMGCRRSDNGIEQAALSYREALHDGSGEGYKDHWRKELRFHYARIQANLADQRERVLEPVPRRKKLGR